MRQVLALTRYVLTLTASNPRPYMSLPRHYILSPLVYMHHMASPIVPSFLVFRIRPVRHVLTRPHTVLANTPRSGLVPYDLRLRLMAMATDERMARCHVREKCHDM